MRKAKVYIHNVFAGILTELEVHNSYSLRKSIINSSFLDKKRENDYLTLLTERFKRLAPYMSKDTIAISGASRGIGLSIAKLFARHHWTIFVAARDKIDLDQMQLLWKKDFPKSKLHCTVADLSTQEGCTLFTENINKHSSQLTILVNNVGQFSPGTLLGGATDQLEHFLQTNLLSAHYLTRALSPLLSKTPKSCLFTIGSIAATTWPAEMATYALSKAALHAWHHGVRLELKKKEVNTCLIIPGGTYTSSWDEVDIDPDKLLTPQEVATLVWKHKDGGKEEVVIVKEA